MQPKNTGKRNIGNANRFVMNMAIVYLAWKVFSYYVNHSAGFVYHVWEKAIYLLGTAYASASGFILNFFGEYTTHSGITVLYPVLNKAIMVEGHCLGIPATVIFVGTIMLFKGDWLNKLWFIPLGVLLIVLINLTRLVLLCYIFAHYPRPFYEINHSLVYVIITYTLIFLLIVWWMRKFSDEKG